MRSRRATGALALSAALLAFAGCRRNNAYVPPPPPEVGVAHPLTRTVTPYLEATGNTVAYNEVDLMARVEGFVQSIDYQDGTPVKAGHQLFVIEPAPYIAKLQQAQASLAAAQAQFAQADAEFKRQSSLGRSDFASQSVVDQARATRDADQANVANQQANVSVAAINLGYTHVNAPWDGVATQHLVSVGALVGVSGPTKLASVVQLDPIYVAFTLSEQEVQRVRVAIARAGLTAADLGKIPVEVGLMTETGYPHRGVLDYAEPQVDQATGTLTVRAVLDNQQRDLLPGYFVRVRIPEPRQAAPALLVPDAALGTAQSGRYVLTVDQQGVVEQRTVVTGQRDGALRVIESGLGPDDLVVVTGLSRAVVGQKATAHTVAMPGG